MSNLRQIVDKSDTVLECKPKDAIDFANEIYRVSALWVTNTRDEVLVAQRSLTNSNGAGQWGPAVAGTIEEGETYETNIYKEADEEIGLKDVVFQIGPKTFHTGERNYFCQWYTAKIPASAIADFALQEDEVNAVAWISKADLMKDVTEHPEKYVPGMNEVVRQFV